MVSGSCLSPGAVSTDRILFVFLSASSKILDWYLELYRPLPSKSFLVHPLIILSFDAALSAHLIGLDDQLVVILLQAWVK